MQKAKIKIGDLISWSGECFRIGKNKSIYDQHVEWDTKTRIGLVFHVDCDSIYVIERGINRFALQKKSNACKIIIESEH